MSRRRRPQPHVMTSGRAGTPLEWQEGMATKIAIAVLLGALGGLLAAASSRLSPQVTYVDDPRAVVVVRAAWQGVFHR